jgi:type VI secretion system protein ImpG
MTPGLETYFERELAFLAEYREAFQKRYPAEAGRLVPDRSKVPDPHLDRFIEGFAALAGRIHHKLDSELPELTEALAQVMYPHLLRPIPSMAMAQVSLDPVELPGTTGLTVPRHTPLRTPMVGKPAVACRWRTGYPVTLWPVDVAEAQIVRGPFVGAPPRTVAALRMQFTTLGDMRFADLKLDKLRFFLSGEKQVIATLYEVLFLNCTKVLFRNVGEKRPPLSFSPQEVFHQVGFALDEGVVPLPNESFVGHRLFLEFLSFPAKFLFLDLSGWSEVAQAGFGSKVEVLCYLTRTHENLEQGVHASTFLLGATPVVNLFSQSAEPLAVTQSKSEYRIVPSRENVEAFEVFSVDEVVGIDEGRPAFAVEPFYHFRLGHGRDNLRSFYHESRRSAHDDEDHGTEVYLYVLDGDWHPRQPANLMLDVQTTCTNRDYPMRFLRGGDPMIMLSQAPGPLGPIICLQAPTPTMRPPRRRAAHWRVLSQLGLNHKTLTDPVDGVRLLQEMLRLCDLSDQTAESVVGAVNRQSIEGIHSLQTRRVLGRASSGGSMGLCRGLEVTIELDEKNYVGVGVFLFACVLERFLGWMTAVNSFSQLVVKTVQGDFVKRWPPRAAERQLL